MVPRMLTCLLAAAVLSAQSDVSVEQLLTKAYAALKDANYDAAIQDFQEALDRPPGQLRNPASVYKDLAYTLLKTGDNESARENFKLAITLDPADSHAVLEYAFLAYEAKQEAQARRIFDRLRKTGNATAEQAFHNIDDPLAANIARWSEAVRLSPDNFSARQELARLCEQRDDLPQAAENYERAWKLRPGERSLLLDLGRVWNAQGKTATALEALLAASRSDQARTAEQARELLPKRYPYVYEFEGAIALDPSNQGLRRELAFLFLAMGDLPKSEAQFRAALQTAPDDLLASAQLGFLLWQRGEKSAAQPLFDRVLHGGDEQLSDRVRSTLNLPQALKRRPETSPDIVAEQARDMADRSMQAGYLPDARKYLTAAHEADPSNLGTVLKLGWINNILHDDREAIEWFNVARKSGDPAVAAEASDAYSNLKPEFQTFRTSGWFNPFFSTRWHDAFGYGQIKTELRATHLPVHFYASTRFIGDTRETVGGSASGVSPQYLSESSFIFGVGVATSVWHGLTGWFEAGEAVKYLPARSDVGAMIPDYRGGLSYAKGLGHALTGGPGWFAETNDDAVFISRFQNDTIAYTQNRAGWTFAKRDWLGGFQAQFYCNLNLTADRLRQYWANYAEAGPGLRFRCASLPKNLLFSINLTRGVYTINEGNPRGPNFYDLRAGVWYAFTR